MQHQGLLMLSRLTLVALEVFDGIGVYWGESSGYNSRQVFESVCEDISADPERPGHRAARSVVERASDGPLRSFSRDVRRSQLRACAIATARS